MTDALFRLISLSDDDLCSDCTHCKAAGQGYTCAVGWPGTTDADGYISECPLYLNSSDAGE